MGIRYQQWHQAWVELEVVQGQMPGQAGSVLDMALVDCIDVAVLDHSHCSRGGQVIVVEMIRLLEQPVGVAADLDNLRTAAAAAAAADHGKAVVAADTDIVLRFVSAWQPDRAAVVR